MNYLNLYNKPLPLGSWTGFLGYFARMWALSPSGFFEVLLCTSFSRHAGTD